MIFMIDNHLLSWVLLWWRAKYSDSVIKGYQVTLQNVFNPRLPNPIRNTCYKIASERKGMKKVKALAGIGVYSQDKIIEFCKEDLRVFSDLSDRLTALGVVAFSNLAQLLIIDKEEAHPLRGAMNESFQMLVRAFQDWDDIYSALDLDTQIPKPHKVAQDTKDPGPAEKQALFDEIEKGKGNEREKKVQKEPEDKKKKNNDKIK